MVKKLRCPSLGRFIGIERGLQWKNQVNLCLSRGSITKILPQGTRIGFLKKILDEVVMLLRDLKLLLDGRNTRLDVLPVWMVNFDVLIGFIR